MLSRGTNGGKQKTVLIDSFVLYYIFSLIVKMDPTLGILPSHGTTKVLVINVTYTKSTFSFRMFK